jgi:O-antigen biosynthesis protein
MNPRLISILACPQCRHALHLECARLTCENCAGSFEMRDQTGGFDEVNLTVAFNDVDFCLRLREAGYWIVWMPHAELVHHESASRGFDDSTPKQVRCLAEIDYMNAKWGDMLQRDPFYNPNLSLGEDLFTLAFPPRTTKPWQSVAA